MQDTLWGTAEDTLWDLVTEILPDEPLYVESPAERAERSFAYSDVAGKYAGDIVAGLVTELTAALESEKADGPKYRHKGIDHVLSLLAGEGK
ncbi:hypothetical protein [Streptomyces sp. CBMA29]|uniref:hypothetical protein n=1 Tax=Streptomyces sp. CBMA29 TaxID=1896314 RepID=UPI001661D916|nr:hypothetical protein [Streptomyces sp. CBMA29]MBD0739819.1 hypothetical protein [Streptomyces sp. CBMA29]